MREIRLQLRQETLEINSDQDVIRVAEEKYNLSAVNRIIMISWCITIAYILFGFVSYELVHTYAPHVTLIENVWPRIAFNVIPFLCLLKFLYSPKINPVLKINAYIVVYCLVFFISSCIHVWPIALSQDPSIILYVSAANVTYLCATWTIAAIPKKLIWQAIAFVAIFIVIPIFYVVSKSDNSLLFATVANDTMMSVIVGLGCGYLLSRLHWKLELISARQMKESSQFLGEPLQKAIFEGRVELLKEQVVSGYIFFLDIRNSTGLAKKYGGRWDHFCKEWLTLAGRVIQKYNGNFIKSSGDGILGGFGLFDDMPDLSDIPGIETDLMNVDERRWVDLTKEAFSCLDDIIFQFIQLTQIHFPDDHISIGCGIDRGNITRGIRGGKDKKEFDIWGDRVNIASKLEGLCKDLYKYNNVDESTSLMVVSPFACDYLDNNLLFKKVDLNPTMKKKILGIPWILYKEYKKSDSFSSVKKKAS